MFRTALDSPGLCDPRSGINRRQNPLTAALLVILLGSGSVPVSSQQAKPPCGEINLLPATTGEPLTVTPIDLPDVQCSVVEWNNTPPKPVLTLLCPRQEVFAPLRVYIKLSWLKPEDVPMNAPTIFAPPNSQTKLRTSKTATLVWLRASEKGKDKPQVRWVSFNGLVDVALLVEPRNGTPLKTRAMSPE